MNGHYTLSESVLIWQSVIETKTLNQIVIYLLQILRRLKEDDFGKIEKWKILT